MKKELKPSLSAIYEAKTLSFVRNLAKCTKMSQESK
jgi:hypothetical protein